MKYTISYTQAHRHFIDIEMTIDSIKANTLTVQLPAWRPGRYELSNFAKNIQKWAAFDNKGNELKSKKITKDSWHIETTKIETVVIRYNYYSTELNAGSTYLDEKQLYINPVNCFLYVPERMNEKCIIELKIPNDYKIATSLNHEEKNSLSAENFNELADSPLIASNSLKHSQFILDGVEFNLWFQGECKLNMPKIINDFFIFINEQFLTMQGCPVTEYHFLFQLLPIKIHHGVEHLKSTVIAIGPAYKMMQDESFFNEFLGVSSHELFHSWNIKTIRPIEMMPYDYTKENYSRLGYVCEGNTTYYGDYMLFRSGIFTETDYFKSFSGQLQKHFDNYGRFNMSVADSSFDTWLDGYNQGIPDRKTSIYTEGCLLAFISDILIRKNTKNKNCLDTAMRFLYNDFGKKQIGYSETDYKNILEKTAGCSFEELFTNCVWGTKSFEPFLNETLFYIGLQINISPSKKYTERHYGFKIHEHNSTCKVTAVAPNSIADLAGLAVNDEIISINGIQLKDDFNEWCLLFQKEKIILTINSNEFQKSIALQAKSGTEYYPVYQVEKINEATDSQKETYRLWSGKKF
ncbi:MAG TPA: PDZ domain-containing protein [Bacteroidia bacterium]|nr:PDZ domain-containing protein [Bacteroidia bacterium]